MKFVSNTKTNLCKNFFLLILLSLITISLIGVVAAQSVAEPFVTKTASPTDINLAGSGVNEETTVTLKVTGAGSTTTAAIPMDVVFSIDSSGSMASNDPSNLRLSAAKTFLEKMNSSRDTSGVVSWDDNIDFSLSLTSDFATLRSKIDTINAEGNTNINAGLQKAIDILDANTRTGDSAKVVIFLSDGQHNTGGSYNSSIASTAASKGYKIYAIGLSSSVDSKPLKDMVNTTGGKYYDSPSAANLQAIFDDIFKQVTASTIPHYVDVVESTQDYIIDESSFNVAPDSVVTDSSGITTITWKNIGKGDGSPDLSADEEIVLSFKAKSNKVGTDLAVDVLGDSKVIYKDNQGIDAGSTDIPQAYINVTGPTVQNEPPVAEAGSDKIVKPTNKTGASITLDGSGSTDDGKISPLTYTWTWTGGSATGVKPKIFLPLGTTKVTLTVFDGQFSSTDTVNISVKDSCVSNKPPVAKAGPDKVVKPTTKKGASITLDGSGSTDDGKISPLTYTWTWTGGSATGVKPKIFLPLGTTKVTLKVFDGQFSSTDTVIITVKDSCVLKPPVAAFSATPIKGKAPLTVKFTDKSTGSITSRSWNFGDKTTSTVKNPVHKYTKKGTYTVSLTVKNAAGKSIAKKTIYVTLK